MRFTLLASLLGLSLLACRGGDDGTTGDDQPQVDAPPGTDPVKIQMVQAATMTPGTAVTLKGVIVTGVDTFGDRTGDIYVQEKEGGEFSGVKVFGVTLDQVGMLKPGDEVTITGAQKAEYRYLGPNGDGMGGFPEGYSITELEPIEGGVLTVTKTGTGTATITDVDAAAIEAKATFEERDAEWEKWEGVLISVKKARQLSGVAPFGSNPGPDSTSFRGTGEVEVQSAMVALPAGDFGGCFEKLVGIGDYFFSYKLYPRMADDMTTGGTDCTPLAKSSISAVQGGATGTVMLENVFVTAVAFNKKSYWVSTTNTAASGEGLYIFGGGTVANTIVPGAKVSIIGKVKEHNNDANGTTLTELEKSSTLFVAAPAGAPTPVSGQTAATLTVEGTGEPYEGVLVTLTNVKVKTIGTSNNNFVTQLSQGATNFIADDDIYRFVAADMDKCYASITGIWTYQVFDNVYALLPLAAGTGTGSCL